MGRHGSWKVGEVAGCINKTLGYVAIGVDGRDYFTHRLAWLYVFGDWPAKQIDHRNCNKADNRIENLRPANHSQNQQNRSKIRIDNTSGITGVSRQDGKWVAAIRIDGVSLRIGAFAEIEAASAARKAAEQRLFTHGPIA